MPTYSYICDKCGRGFSLMRRREDRGAPASCPKCKTEITKRLPSNAKSFSVRNREGAPKPQSIESPAGIYIEGGDSILVADNRINGTTGSGIAVRGAGHHFLINNSITRKPIGVVVEDDARIDDFNTVIE